MYWTSSESQPPPPPPTLVEERIPILARRRSSGEIEVLRWCSRARPRVNTNVATDSRPLVTSPLRAEVNDSNSESGSVITTSTTAARRNLSLPWTNRRLLPNYTALVSPGWSTTSSSDDESSDEDDDDAGSYRPFGPNYNTFSSNSSTYYNDTPSSSAAGDEGNDNPFMDNDDVILPANEQVTLLSLPYKPQLLALALCRLSEPLTQVSVISYFYYFIRALSIPDRSPTPGEIAGQVGMLASIFLLCQWHSNRFLDPISERIGYKPYILIGLAGTAISLLGLGLAHTLTEVILWCVVGGTMSGNVSVLRAMVLEILDEERHQVRALQFIPICQNVGIILGAILGGLLVDPAGASFTLPSIVNVWILLVFWVVAFLLLQETPEKKVLRRDWGVEARRKFQERLREVYGSFKVRGKHPTRPNDDSKGDYTTITIPIPSDEESVLPSSSSASTFSNPTTPDVCSTPFRALSSMASNCHISAFLPLLALYFSAPRPTGLGLTAPTVGLAIAYMGLIALTIQLLPPPNISPRLIRYFVPLSYLSMPLLPNLSASWTVLALGLQAGAMVLGDIEVTRSLVPAVPLGRVIGPVLIGSLYPFCASGIWLVMAVLATMGAWGMDLKIDDDDEEDDLEAARD